MNSAEHKAEAERLIRASWNEQLVSRADRDIALAQVHAILANVPDVQILPGQVADAVLPWLAEHDAKVWSEGYLAEHSYRSCNPYRPTEVAEPADTPAPAYEPEPVPDLAAALLASVKAAQAAHGLTAEEAKPDAALRLARALIDREDGL